MQTLFLRSSRVGALTVGAILGGLIMAGCHDDNPPANTVVTTPAPAPTPTTTVTTPPGTTTVATTPDTKINTNAGPGTSNGTDTALADAVNAAITHNHQMTGSRVEPVATAGVVTLTGQVQNQQQKALAEKTASQVPGVSSVKNKLIIVTTGGIKPKPIVITKIQTKTIVVHDKNSPPPTAETGTDDSNAPSPPVPDSGAPPAAPNSSGNP